MSNVLSKYGWAFREYTKSVASILLPEINVLRQEVTDLKARVAALDSGDSTALNQRTPEQVRNAFKAELDLDG